MKTSHLSELKRLRVVNIAWLEPTVSVQCNIMESSSLHLTGIGCDESLFVLARHGNADLTQTLVLQCHFFNIMKPCFLSCNADTSVYM